MSAARPCLTADEIHNLIRAADVSPDVQHHLLNCAACKRQVSLARRVEAAGVAAIADAVHEVDGLFARLLARPRRHWWQVVKEIEFQRPDLVRFILTRVFDERLRDPGLALDLANAATAIVDRLPRAVAGAVRFDSWMYTASLLRERARYGEAEKALTRAEDASPTAPEPELALASVWLARALLSAEPDVWKPAEAEALLDQAEAVFAARGDLGHIAAVLTTRAFLLFRSRDLQGSRRQFEALLHATSITDREAHLNALSNLVVVRVELGEIDFEVESEVQRLIDENGAIGRTVQVARARWMMGRIKVAHGLYDEAVELFRCAASDIADDDASIRIGLDAAEALLLGGRLSEGQQFAHALTSAAVALDQREPTRRRSLTAQAYQTEAAHRQN